jgi:CubicO group peptidase (beta-lactamase class C family)
MRRDTIFRIASMTKLVTAAAAMMLIDDGKLKLGEPVERLLPAFGWSGILVHGSGQGFDLHPAHPAGLRQPGPSAVAQGLLGRQLSDSHLASR